MSKIARITNDKKIFLGEEIIEYPPELEGGRNLLPDSHEEKGKTLGDSQAEHLYYADIYDILDKHLGRKLTISFDVEARVGHYLQAYCSNRSDDRTFVSHTFRNFGTEKQRLSFTTTSIEGGRGTHNKQAFLEFYGQYETGNVFKISNVKIELGDKATPWTPAPEDLGLTYPDFVTRFGTYFKNNTLATQEIIEYSPELEGGRNLLLNSEKLTNQGGNGTGISRSINDDGDVVVIVEADNNNYASNFGMSESANYIENILKDGDLVTFSVEIKSEDSTHLPDFYFKAGMGYFPMEGQVSTEFSRIYVTKEWIKNDRLWSPHLGFRGRPGVYVFRRAKLEKGNKTTDWTPAPEDLGLIYPDNIQSFGLKLSQNNGLMTRELIEYPKELLNSGRNLIRNSAEMHNALDSIRISLMYSRDGLVEGTYTISFDYEIITNNDSVPIGNFLLYSTSSIGNVIIESGITEGKAMLTFDIVAAKANGGLYIYGGRSAAQGRLTDVVFRNLKLEKGSTATPWTPAPEDLGYNI